MNGCLHGRWVLGIAHSNPTLPATVVRKCLFAIAHILMHLYSRVVYQCS